jgi:hypothetical protein
VQVTVLAVHILIVQDTNSTLQDPIITRGLIVQHYFCFSLQQVQTSHYTQFYSVSILEVFAGVIIPVQHAQSKVNPWKRGTICDVTRGLYCQQPHMLLYMLNTGNFISILHYVGDLKFGCGNKPITGAVYSFQKKLLIVEIYFYIHCSK